ncbi:MAG TPA: NFACT RNA binding domain-containing protein [Aggregatilineales bacterium]|nr:NFACT RNA binding domain-containing protein [Aggregatilineales bacterium]
MNFDVFTIAALVDELSDRLDGGRIQDTLELGDDALGFEIYARRSRHYLLISADPQQARLHLVPEKLRRGVETPSPLGLLIRRHLEGARLVAIRQPAWERVVMLEFEGSEGPVSLIVEPMERRGNILLVREGQIMDCIRRVGPSDNRVRLSLPGHAYVPPPPQLNKHAPTQITLELIRAILEADPGKPAWRALSENLLAFSPMLAKESVYRTTQAINTKSGDTSARALYDAICALIDPLLRREWEPGLTETDGQTTGYAVYRVTHLTGWRRTESINAALAEFYGAPVGIEAYETAKKPIRTVIEEAIEKVTRRLEALRRSHRDESERERLRQSGELLLAYQYQIAPGQTTFSAQYDFDQPPLDIALEPALSPLDNAKRYFEQYEKAKRAAAEVPALIEDAEQEIDFLRQLATDLALAANWPEMGEVQDALQANGYWRGPQSARPRGAKSGPLKIVADDGTVIWVGRNARQNEEVTFGKGRPEDLWLHVRGVPGAHVIVKSGGRPVSSATLSRAAALAAYYSAYRNEGKALVDVTERRYVRKIRGGKPGMVTYRNEAPIEATPGT